MAWCEDDGMMYEMMIFTPIDLPAHGAEVRGSTRIYKSSLPPHIHHTTISTPTTDRQATVRTHHKSQKRLTPQNHPPLHPHRPPRSQNESVLPIQAHVLCAMYAPLAYKKPLLKLLFRCGTFNSTSPAPPPAWLSGLA